MSACPICGNTDVVNRDELRHCLACGHIYQGLLQVTATYDAAYFSRYERYPTAQMSHLRVGFLKAFVPSGRLLDIGYGTGAFVRVATAAGFDAYGNEVHGIDCGVRELSLLHAAQAWDVVTMFDALEHFAEFGELRDVFKYARVVMVSVPLAPPHFPDRRDWRHYKPGEHLHYFSRRSLQLLIGKPHVHWSDLEDTIRKADSSHQNILTGLFTSEPAGWVDGSARP